MTRWQEIFLTASLSAAIPIVGGLIWLGKLDNRIENLEKAIALRSSVQAPIDPVRQQCALLAVQLAGLDIAAFPGQSQSDSDRRPRVKEAMDALGCIRTN